MGQLARAWGVRMSIWFPLKFPKFLIYTYNVCKLRGLVRPVCMWITSLSLAREISTSHENLSAQELVSE